MSERKANARDAHLGKEMIDISTQSVKECASQDIPLPLLEAHLVKVRVHGFSWRLTSGASLPEFFTFLHETSGQQIVDQIMAVAPLRGRKELWGGVLLTVKDQKAFTQMTREVKSFKVAPKELDANANPVDVNFFIFNVQTGRGLYLYYHHSAALSEFGNFASHRFMSYKELNGIKRGRLKQQVVYREAAFKEYMSQLEHLRAFEFEAETYLPKGQGDFRSLTDRAHRARHRLVFFVRKTSDQQSIKKEISQLVDDNLLSFARVEGYDENGLETVYKLVNDPDKFAEYEYDAFVRAVSINAEDFDKTINSATHIKELLRLYDDEEVINRLMTVEEEE